MQHKNSRVISGEDTGTADLLTIYRWMVMCRKFDEAWVSLYHRKKCIERPHSNIGEEAIGVGSLYKLPETDYVVPSLRTSPVFIMRGVPLVELFCGVMGKAGGSSNGKAPMHHLGDNARGIIGTTGVIGSQLPIATGVALASKLRKENNVTLCFFGDGASNRGDFHEALNFAGLKKLPVVFVVENNRYSEWTPIEEHLPIKNIADRASAYGFPGRIVDGNDVLAVHATVQDAIALARKGEGPTLIECKSYRLHDHAEGFRDGRDESEISRWKEMDPLKSMRTRLLSKGSSSVQLENIDAEVNQLVDSALKDAEVAGWPELRLSEGDVYADSDLTHNIDSDRAVVQEERKITFGTAINEGLREEMRKDSRVFLIGEDLSYGPNSPPMGGVWPATAGIYREFPERVINTPISESEIVGATVGASLVGMRPICEIMYADFLSIAMDQIVNSAAKMRFNYGGKISLGLVIRAPFGDRGNDGLYHAQCIESWLMNVPGLKLVMPSTPYDAKGLLKSSIRDNNPIVFLEHKNLYFNYGNVPSKEYAIPLGRASVRKEGKDVTIVAFGQMLAKVLNVANKLEDNNTSVEVIDPRTLRPLDSATIVNSVRKTGRLIIVQEAPKFGGFGAEIAAQIAEDAIYALKSPIVRIGAPETPVPFSPGLAAAYLPSEEKIEDEILRILR